jgi:two-component system, cell cycle sensor histidine kinase and response regulator CckA
VNLFESIPQPAWIYDLGTLRVLAVSRSAIRDYGYTHDEFLAMTIEELRPPGEVESLRAHLRGQEGEAGHSVWRHLRKDGTTLSVQIAAETVSYEGRPARLVVATDVTEWVSTTEELREAEGNFHRIADHVPVILWSSSSDARSTWVNRQWLNFRGTTLDAELGRGWLDAVHPDDVGPYLKVYEEAVGARKSLYFVFRGQDKAGQWRHLLARGEPYHASDGSFQGYLGTCTDVTDQVQATEEVSRQNELLKTVFDNIPAMIVRMDDSLNVLTVNHEMERVTGYSADELRGMEDVVATLYPESKSAAQAREFIFRADRNWAEFQLRAKDGTLIPTAWANAKLSDGSLVGIGEDITERKRLEAQLRQAQKMESVGRLAGGIAHDFNNLLTAILGFSSLAAREVGADSAARRSLDEVRKAGERAASLTRQLLIFSRKEVVMPETVDLGEIVEDMTGMLRRMIGEDVRLHTTPVMGDATVRVDRGQIEQVLVNLAVNSRDAMPQGGDLSFQVERVGDGEPDDGAPSGVEDRVVLSVRDTGIGMDEVVRVHIFEPFFTTKPEGEGTGLGLATVYGIVQQSGGSIEVETEPGKGTTFRISLPWQPRQPQASRDNESGAPAPRGSEAVLLIEDEDAVRRLVAAVLEGDGYHVVLAASGEEAIRIASDPGRTIDLVLSDLIMPGTNGREAVEHIQGLRPDLPHLYMSGYTNDAFIQRGIRMGDSPFIQKPFLPSALLAKVRQVLDVRGRGVVAAAL